jgi:hypothetical protein
MEEKELIRGVLCQFSDIFSKTDFDLGLADPVKHSIDKGTPSQSDNLQGGYL